MSEPMEHVCLCGTAACSGANPCQKSAALVDERVLPAALVAAGLNGALLALVHCFAQALYQRGVDPANLALSQTGVPLSSVFASPEQQAQAFRAAYREAWGRMLVAMQTEPALLASVVRTPVAGVQGYRDAGVQVQEPPQQELPLDVGAKTVPGSVTGPSGPVSLNPSTPVSPTPSQALPATLVDTAAYEAFLQKGRSAPTVQAPPAAAAPVVEDQASRMSVPMDAEDIAAAGLAVAPPAPSSSAALPNGSPPVLG